MSPGKRTFLHPRRTLTATSIFRSGNDGDKASPAGRGSSRKGTQSFLHPKRSGAFDEQPEDRANSNSNAEEVIDGAASAPPTPRGLSNQRQRSLAPGGSFVRKTLLRMSKRPSDDAGDEAVTELKIESEDNATDCTGEAEEEEEEVVVSLVYNEADNNDDANIPEITEDRTREATIGKEGGLNNASPWGMSEHSEEQAPRSFGVRPASTKAIPRKSSSTQKEEQKEEDDESDSDCSGCSSFNSDDMEQRQEFERRISLVHDPFIDYSANAKKSVAEKMKEKREAKKREEEARKKEDAQKREAERQRDTDASGGERYRLKERSSSKFAGLALASLSLRPSSSREAGA